MELVIRVKTYNYLLDLFNHLGDKGYMWHGGGSLYNEEFAEEAWKDCGSRGMLILLEDDLVTYAELEFRFFCGDRKIIDCDTIEELLVVGKALKDFHQDKDDYDGIAN
jgi:hypothetical protein|nr:MAG TPA: hypothetical protein [Caudoviricetes sp.]